MAYTILKSDGTLLTTIADGQINTTSTSLGLPGRNYAGYGQVLDTNFTHLLENFADSVPPSNPLQGQLWFDTGTNSLRICPSDGETVAANWYTLLSQGSNSTATFGNIVITGTTYTTNISTGSANTTGNITGTWTLSAGSSLQATYADIAERFESETRLEPGTVVELGGAKEIRAVQFELSDDVFGVVSNTAAYLLNATAGTDVTHPPIAVSGRVSVKVVGKIVKGQRLVSAGNGLARGALEGEASTFNTIGRSLEDKLTEGQGTVLAIVSIR